MTFSKISSNGEEIPMFSLVKNAQNESFSSLTHEDEGLHYIFDIFNSADVYNQYLLAIANHMKSLLSISSHSNTVTSAISNQASIQNIWPTAYTVSKSNFHQTESSISVLPTTQCLLPTIPPLSQQATLTSVLHHVQQSHTLLHSVPDTKETSEQTQTIANSQHATTWGSPHLLLGHKNEANRRAVKTRYTLPQDHQQGVYNLTHSGDGQQNSGVIVAQDNTNHDALFDPELSADSPPPDGLNNIPDTTSQNTLNVSTSDIPPSVSGKRLREDMVDLRPPKRTRAGGLGEQLAADWAQAIYHHLRRRAAIKEKGHERKPGVAVIGRKQLSILKKTLEEVDDAKHNLSMEVVTVRVDS